MIGGWRGRGKNNRESLGKIAHVYRVGMGVRKIRFESGASCFELLRANESLGSCFAIDVAKEQRRVDWGISADTALSEMMNWGGSTTGKLIKSHCAYHELPVGQPESHFSFPWEDSELIASIKSSFHGWGDSIRLDHGSLRHLEMPHGLLPNADDARRMARHIREEELWNRPDPFAESTCKKASGGGSSRARRVEKDRRETVDSIRDSRRDYLDDLASKIVKRNQRLSIEGQAAINELVAKENSSLIANSKLLSQDQADQILSLNSFITQQRQIPATKQHVANRGGTR